MVAAFCGILARMELYVPVVFPIIVLPVIVIESFTVKLLPVCDIYLSAELVKYKLETFTLSFMVNP